MVQNRIGAEREGSEQRRRVIWLGRDDTGDPASVELSRRELGSRRSRLLETSRGDRMTQADLETFLAGLPNVQRIENFGYTFFFVGDDHRLPFVTIANFDNEFDDVSNLDREGVFRVNIGISRATFEQLGLSGSEAIDYSVLNTFLPHPHYARQNFVC